MQAHTSLGQKVSNKISSWIFVLVISVITTIFIVSLTLSQQMFNKQINIWNTIAPQQILTNLVDSDHFAIEREVEFLKSTGLFSSFGVVDNKKKMIASFKNDNFSNINFLPIQDSAKVVWGYYYFKPDFIHFISPFLFAAGIFLLLIMFLYFSIRWRIRMSLESEFTKFNKFLAEIEDVTERLHEIYDLDTERSVEFKLTLNSEQIIINKAISRLLNEIKKSNNSLRKAIAAAEQRRFQEELTRTALQVVHDIASPIAVLGIVESTAVSLPEDSRVLIRRAISNIRDISNTFLKKARKDFSTHSNLEKQALQSLIDQIITEKRAEYGDQIQILFDFSKDSHKIFSLIKATELSRVLSNLINNSVDAMEHDNRKHSFKFKIMDKVSLQMF
jgi:signal transduction histidine kinase